MTESSNLAYALAAGVVLGAMFFGVLWWTVRRGVSSQRVAPWFFGSLLLRMSVVLAGFYLVADRHWERLLLCFLGFVIARVVVIRLTRPAEAHPHPASEAGHAP